MNFINKKELAEKLKVSVVTIDRLRKQGLPFHKVGAKIVFDWVEVTEWIKRGDK
ncbi:helix-turn-helix domain-containing protein [Clostridium sp.]